MWTMLTRIVAASAIPKIIDEISDFLKLDDTPSKKPIDKRKFTDKEKELIKTLYANWLVDGKFKGQNQNNLAESLNAKFKCNKSTSSYRRIWNEK